MKTTTIALLMLLALPLLGCDKEKELREKEQELIEQYLAEHQVTVAPTASGLYYIPTQVGTGAQPQAGQRVWVHYTGRFVDGEIFDSSMGRDPLAFYLDAGQVIDGFDEGVSYMRVGGKATLLIPSDIGYGANGTASIDPYTPLVFELELVQAN